ncbi:hypothetical protein [Flavobacterium sp. UBA6046]|uniref:hypothetical protein n=1 Tax=Flavobacterium sp. UBA6046 TaxID=1946552 RepID=UPI0025B9D1F2|nr:hypothetical protein [Flavobacterium sp. UBA6046]
MYEDHRGVDLYKEPTELIETIAQIINKIKFEEPTFIQNGNKIFAKERVPKKQVLALYAINKISTKANSN